MVILNKKLKWNKHIEERRKKTYIAKGIVAKSAIRLSAAGQFRQFLEGHAMILEANWGVMELKENDYFPPHLRFNRKFELHIPSRAEWSSEDIDKNYDINVYTGGSKMECGTGAGVYSEILGISESIKLKDSCTVF